MTGAGGGEEGSAGRQVHSGKRLHLLESERLVPWACFWAGTQAEGLGLWDGYNQGCWDLHSSLRPRMSKLGAQSRVFEVLPSVWRKLWFPWWLSGKESACNAEDLGSIPESRRFSGERNGNPFQYSCLENSTDRGTWRATVFGVAKESGD